MKRLLDLAVAALVSLVTTPVVAFGALCVWMEDGRPVFYIARRIGRDGRFFGMFKLRSMVRDADATGVDSTAADDARLLRVGRWLRRGKIDELPQFWNVLTGDMSLVGPRPNVEREVLIYTEAERGLQRVRPGVTDLSSIVFSDYEHILRGRPDPDMAYNQLIRPWKSRLGLLYVASPWSLWLDIRLIFLTALSIVSRRLALSGAAALVRELGGDDALVAVARRQLPLVPTAPPGATEVVRSREPRQENSPLS